MDEGRTERWRDGMKEQKKKKEIRKKKKEIKAI